jgi:predicted nucleotidyltransferase
MSLFQELDSKARERGLEFIVIGGLAVIFHGFSRDTADLDLLVRRGARAAWLELLMARGYTMFRDAHVFVQMSPPQEGAWPIDLMLVNDSTFDPMLQAAREVEMYGAKLKIPALEHLLALKLHALKHGHIERYSKDLMDVEGMVRANSIDMTSEKIRQIFLRYGTMKLYEQISRFTSGH